MGHSRAEIFDKYYINQIVGTDTQSAYLGTPSKDALIKLAGHMGLTRDPKARQSVKPNRLAITLDPEVQSLENLRAQLKADITARYGPIKAAKGTELYEIYHTTLADLRNRKELVKRQAFDE